jgi:hypothetical protein
VLAVTVNGEVSWAPSTGAVTVMAAAGIVLARSAIIEKAKVFIDFPRIKMSELVLLASHDQGLGYQCRKLIGHL